MSRFLQRLIQRATAATGATTEPADAAQAATAQPDANAMVDLCASTGALVPELLHEDEVSAPMLLRLFRQAYMPVESQPGERLLLTTDSGTRLQVAVDTGRRLVSFMVMYEMHPDAALADKLAFVNRVNDRVVFVRFSLLDDDMLHVDHQLPYDGGVTAAAVMGCVRRVGRIAPQAIAEFAEPGLMR